MMKKFFKHVFMQLA